MKTEDFLEKYAPSWGFRIWMQANLRWALTVGALAIGVLALLLTALISPNIWSLIAMVAGLAALLFVVFCTGARRGLFLKPVCRLSGKEPRIALTFDDGPDPHFTPLILAILRNHKIAATFFMTGQAVRDWPDLARQVARDGHEIANHTNLHRRVVWMGAARFDAELKQANESFRMAGLHPAPMFRPPYGSKNPVIEWRLRRMGYQLIHWDISSKDWKKVDPKRLLAWLLRFVRPGSIVLMHDTANAVAILPAFIERMRQKGFHFVRVGDALGLKGQQASARRSSPDTDNH